MSRPVIVKLGGSLQCSPQLPPWLALLARHGQGRVVVVPGGGRFTEEARATQAHWRFDDVHAHNLAVLGMAQVAEVFHALQPGLARGRSVAELRGVLAAQGVPVWQPLDLLRETPNELTNWDATSDSCAAWLARQLDARALWIVKSCDVPLGLGLQALSERGVVDRALPGMAGLWGGPVQVLEARQVAQAERWLVS